MTAPGPTLEEVREGLAQWRAANTQPAREAERRRVLGEVEAAWTDEAEEIVAHDDLELCRRVPVAAAQEPTNGGAARGGVEVRHRFDPRPAERSSAARVVTLRDRRRGRPRRRDKRGDSDPPG